MDDLSFQESKVYPRLLLISLNGDLKPISQATQHMYHCTYFKIMYIQNDSQGLILVLGACEKISNECVSRHCESQPIAYNYFLILQGVPAKKVHKFKIMYLCSHNR